MNNNQDNKYVEFPIDWTFKKLLPSYVLKKSSRPNTYDTVCPFCGKPRKFHLEGNFCRCVAGCTPTVSNGSGWNSVTFCAELLGTDTKEAYKTLLGLMKGDNMVFEASQKAEEKQTPNVAMLAVRGAFYEELDEQLTLCFDHEDNLVKRGMSREDIKKSGIKTFPQIGIISFTQNALERSGVSRYLNGNKDQIPGLIGWGKNARLISHPSAMLIPIRWYTGEISAFQIRNDDAIIEKKAIKEEKKRQREAEAEVKKLLAERKSVTQEQLDAMKPRDIERETPRYTFLASGFNEKGVSCSNIENVHFVGPDFDFENQIAPKEVNLTEGCLKADVASSLSGKDYIGIMGVNMTSRVPEALKWLHEHGTHRINVCFDMDFYQNENVSAALAKMGILLNENGFPIVFSEKDLENKYVKKVMADINSKWLENIADANDLLPDVGKIKYIYKRDICRCIGKKVTYGSLNATKLVEYLNQFYNLSPEDMEKAKSFIASLMSAVKGVEKPYRILPDEEIKNVEYSSRIRTWNPKYKGIDDFLLAWKETHKK